LEIGARGQGRLTESIVGLVFENAECEAAKNSIFGSCDRLSICVYKFYVRFIYINLFLTLLLLLVIIKLCV